MIELAQNDRRLVALKNGKPIISLVELHFAADQGGTRYFSSSGNDIKVMRDGAEVRYEPHVLQSISDHVITAKVQRNEMEIGFIDRDFKTPALSLYNKIRVEGDIGLMIKIGVFFRDDNPAGAYTDPLFDFVGRLWKTSRKDALISVKAVSFLDNIDDYQVRSLTPTSQRAADPNDSSLDLTETARQHAFGGASRD